MKPKVWCSGGNWYVTCAWGVCWFPNWDSAFDWAYWWATFDARA